MARAQGRYQPAAFIGSAMAAGTAERHRLSASSQEIVLFG